MQTRLYSGLSGLHQLCKPWISLHANVDLYGRFEWHLACAKHLLGDAGSLSYVQFLDGARTIAIIPAISSIAPIPCFGRLRLLSLGLHTHLALTDFPLADDISIDDVAAALHDALDNWPEPWDALRWPRVLGTSHAKCLALRMLAPSAHIVSDAPCNILDTQGTYEERYAGLSKNLRASLRKSQKRLEESGGAHITRNGVATEPSHARTPELSGVCANSIQTAYDSFLALEASGWKGEVGTRSAIGLHPGLRGFYAELLAQRSMDFVPEVTVLSRGDAAIAAQFSVCVNGCKQVLKIGYDESESQFSPGQVLMAGVLEAASKSGIKRISLVTNMPWHQAWRPIPEPTFCVTVFRRRWRAAFFASYLKARGLAKLVMARIPMHRKR